MNKRTDPREAEWKCSLPFQMSKQEIAEMVMRALEEGLSGFTIETDEVRITFEGKEPGHRFSARMTAP
jgi:hypothetical protein